MTFCHLNIHTFIHRFINNQPADIKEAILGPRPLQLNERVNLRTKRQSEDTEEEEVAEEIEGSGSEAEEEADPINCNWNIKVSFEAVQVTASLTTHIILD